MTELKFKIPKEEEVLSFGTNIWFVLDNKVVNWFITSITIKSWSYQEYKDYQNRTDIGDSIEYSISPTLICNEKNKGLLLSDIKLWRKTKEELIQSL